MANIRITAAAETLSTHWIPICPQIQNVIVTKFRRGHYNSDLSLLVTDLSKDIGLFGYCLKRLYQSARQAGKKSPAPFDLTGLFAQCERSELDRILDEKPENISLHRFDDASEHQISCFHQVLVSATASETICEKARFPKNFGFAASILRQLGLTLIAWNYPHVLKQAVKASEKGEALDQALLKLLGYSPRTLALAVGHSWGVSPELEFALGNSEALAVSSADTATKIRTASEILKKSCEVGEILARASHPEMYPPSRGEWSEAKKRIQHALGPEGFALIQKRIATACKSYVGADLPKLEKLSEVPVGPQKVTDDGPTSDTSPGNTAHIELPLGLRQKIRTFYSDLSPDGQQKKILLLRLTKDIVPVAGFSGGTILMFDFESSELVPRYTFGECRLPTEKVYCSALSAGSHPAVLAFRSEKPVFEFNAWSETESLGHIAQTFGTIQRIGVLYLEIGKALEGRSVEDVLAHFAAIKRALQDCLGVK